MEIIETERLRLREMTTADLDLLEEMLRDPEIQRFWGDTFDDQPLPQWVFENHMRYVEDGCAYMVAELRVTGEPIGQVGLLENQVGHSVYYTVDAMFIRKHWEQGFALEGTRACVEYAFDKLGAQQVICVIEADNLRSLRIVKALGMHRVDGFEKYCLGQDRQYETYQLIAPYERGGN